MKCEGTSVVLTNQVTSLLMNCLHSSLVCSYIESECKELNLKTLDTNCNDMIDK